MLTTTGTLASRGAGGTVLCKSCDLLPFGSPALLRARRKGISSQALALAAYRMRPSVCTGHNYRSRADPVSWGRYYRQNFTLSLYHVNPRDSSHFSKKSRICKFLRSSYGKKKIGNSLKNTQLFQHLPQESEH